MPTMANLVVKKADETTNITYDAIGGAAGDGSFAIWRQDTGAAAGLPLGHRAVVSISTKWNGPRTARKATVRFHRPYSVLNSSTNRYESTDSVVGEMTVTVPQAIPAAEINESIYQALNCIGLASGLIKQSMAGGFAPT